MSWAHAPRPSRMASPWAPSGPVPFRPMRTYGGRDAPNGNGNRAGPDKAEGGHPFLCIT